MSWTLGSLTIKSPANYTPVEEENSVLHETLGNRYVKQIRGRKIRHLLDITNLPQAEITAIRAEINQNIALDFSVSDGVLNISLRKVLPKITSRAYPYKGPEFREQISLELLEVN